MTRFIYYLYLRGPFCGLLPVTLLVCFRLLRGIPSPALHVRKSFQNELQKNVVQKAYMATWVRIFNFASGLLPVYFWFASGQFRFNHMIDSGTKPTKEQKQ